MGFQTDVVVNYDPHYIISIRRRVNKNMPFEHNEIAGMEESVNWIDYPHETQRDADMQEDSTSSVKEVSSTQPDPSSIVPTSKRITLVGSCSERTNKRDFSDVMETEEEYTTKTPKKNKVEETGKLVQVTYDKGKNKKHMKVKGPAFEFKDYAFSETPTDSTSQF